MDSVILPSLTDQMVLGVFKYLVEAELRKKLENQQEFRFGCQEGAIAMMVLMFGETDSVTAEKAYDAGKTWIHIVGDIQEDLQDWVDLNRDKQFNHVDLQDAVDKAVNNYALKHPMRFGDALRVNL